MMNKGFFCGLLLAALLFSVLGETTTPGHDRAKEDKAAETTANAASVPATTPPTTKDDKSHAGHVTTVMAGKCMKARRHKQQPSKETLEGICAPWSESSCCNATTAKDIHDTDGSYNFKWSHCEHDERHISKECLNWFRKDLCFYECSSHGGPWIAQESPARKWREERFRNLPLCQSECNDWFAACKDDFTCSDNWYTGFNYSTGEGVCINTTCRTISDTFGNAKNFCEKVWDNSFKVVPNNVTMGCIKINVDAEGVQKNGKVANEYYQTQKATGGQTRLAAGISVALSVALLWIVQ